MKDKKMSKGKPEVEIITLEDDSDSSKSTSSIDSVSKIAPKLLLEPLQKYAQETNTILIFRPISKALKEIINNDKKSIEEIKKELTKIKGKQLPTKGKSSNFDYIAGQLMFDPSLSKIVESEVTDKKLQDERDLIDKIVLNSKVKLGKFERQVMALKDQI